MLVLEPNRPRAPAGASWAAAKSAVRGL